MQSNRIAAKRRASFGRADRLRKEARQKAEQAKTEQRRKEERDKADRQRKAEAVKAAEQRIAQARKRAEHLRLQRHRENLQKEFSRKAEDKRARDTRAAQQRKMEAAKAASYKQQPADRDPKQRDAEGYVAHQEQRQQTDQRDEHRRQTQRLRSEHDAQREGGRNRAAAAIIEHARKIRNIDIAERRELEALDASRRSFTGRVTGLVRGAKHFVRQGQAIADRHENDRWQKHRDHEVRKDNLFWTEQTARLRRASERMAIAKDHQNERLELNHAQAHSRPQRVQDHVRALERVAQISIERSRRQENVRPTEGFGQAAGQVHQLKPKT